MIGPKQFVVGDTSRAFGRIGRNRVAAIVATTCLGSMADKPILPNMSAAIPTIGEVRTRAEADQNRTPAFRPSSGRPLVSTFPPVVRGEGRQGALLVAPLFFPNALSYI
jgi:hypothetical protein